MVFFFFLESRWGDGSNMLGEWWMGLLLDIDDMI